MSPATALHSDVFLRYVWIIAGVLAISGAVLASLTYGLRKDVGHVWRIWRSWLVMAPLGLGCAFAGRAALIVGMSLVSLVAFKEFARATGLYRDWWMVGAVYADLIALCVVSLMRHPRGGPPGWYGLFMAAPVYGIALLVMIPILRNRAEGQLQAMSLGILGFLYIGWMFGHFGFLANSDHPYGYLLFVGVATELTDVSAFTLGKLLGRHRLRSAISPNKTWGGALGALAVSMALPWLLRFSFPNFGTTQLVLTGLIVGIGSQLGDLCISVIKRDIGIKDMAGTIPGHGGVLDRIDSLIYVAPLFLHMVDYCYRIW
jgi:phosphatidate cytidylyltransferase